MDANFVMAVDRKRAAEAVSRMLERVGCRPVPMERAGSLESAMERVSAAVMGLEEALRELEEIREAGR